MTKFSTSELYKRGVVLEYDWDEDYVEVQDLDLGLVEPCRWKEMKAVSADVAQAK